MVDHQGHQEHYNLEEIESMEHGAIQDPVPCKQGHLQAFVFSCPILRTPCGLQKYQPPGISRSQSPYYTKLDSISNRICKYTQKVSTL